MCAVNSADKNTSTREWQAQFRNYTHVHTQGHILAIACDGDERWILVLGFQARQVKLGLGLIFHFFRKIFVELTLKCANSAVLATPFGLDNLTPGYRHYPKIGLPWELPDFRSVIDLSPPATRLVLFLCRFSFFLYSFFLLCYIFSLHSLFRISRLTHSDITAFWSIISSD